jgi:hypothetical protein
MRKCLECGRAGMLYAGKGVHTLFTGQRDRERERERKKERDKEKERKREKELD